VIHFFKHISYRLPYIVIFVKVNSVPAYFELTLQFNHWFLKLWNNFSHHSATIVGIIKPYHTKTDS